MKHVIVIVTADGPDGFQHRPIADWLEESIVDLIDARITAEHGTCAIQTRFNVSSAIAAVHEMYGAPSWNPNDVPSR